MASGAVTNLDDVLALCFEGEVFVEGGNRICLGFRDADGLCHMGQQLCGQITEFSLDILHDGDQGLSIGLILRDDLVRRLVVRCIQHRGCSSLCFKIKWHCYTIFNMCIIPLFGSIFNVAISQKESPYIWHIAQKNKRHLSSVTGRQVSLYFSY